MTILGTLRFFKRTGSGMANSAEQANQDILPVKVFYFQIVKSLSTLFIIEKLAMSFNNWLILFFNSQVY